VDVPSATGLRISEKELSPQDGEACLGSQVKHGTFGDNGTVKNQSLRGKVAFGARQQYPNDKWTEVLGVSAHRPRPAFGLASQAKVRDNHHVRNRRLSKDTMMQHSTVTRKGQTTIPGKIRQALRINPGDTLEYVVEGDHATIRVNPGARSLKGVLASKKGKGMSFTQIREAAASAARNREGSR
jgi:AbrB family looped-hinge helix DNA binding protein